MLKISPLRLLSLAKNMLFDLTSLALILPKNFQSALNPGLIWALGNLKSAPRFLICTLQAIKSTLKALDKLSKASNLLLSGHLEIHPFCPTGHWPFRANALLLIHFFSQSLKAGHRVPLTMCDPWMTFSSKWFGKVDKLFGPNGTTNEIDSSERANISL